MRSWILNWQPRYRWLSPVDRRLCVPIFRLVCPYYSYELRLDRNPFCSVSSLYGINRNTNKRKKNLSQKRDDDYAKSGSHNRGQTTISPKNRGQTTIIGGGRCSMSDDNQKRGLTPILFLVLLAACGDSGTKKLRLSGLTRRRRDRDQEWPSSGGRGFAW